jgi:hypothetical protein
MISSVVQAIQPVFWNRSGGSGSSSSSSKGISVGVVGVGRLGKGVGTDSCSRRGMS